SATRPQRQLCGFPACCEILPAASRDAFLPLSVLPRPWSLPSGRVKFLRISFSASFEWFGRELAALLDQLEGGAQAVFQFLATPQLLDARRNRQPVALDCRTSEAQLHILKIRLEDPNLPH